MRQSKEAIDRSVVATIQFQHIYLDVSVRVYRITKENRGKERNSEKNVDTNIQTQIPTQMKHIRISDMCVHTAISAYECVSVCTRMRICLYVCVWVLC